MEPTSIAMGLGLFVLGLAPFVVQLVISRRLKKEDESLDAAVKLKAKADESAATRIHESFERLSADIRDERKMREILNENIMEVKLAQAAYVLRNDIDGIYEHIDEVRQELKADINSVATAVNNMTAQMIQALAARGGRKSDDQG